MSKQEFKTVIDVVNKEFENGGYLHPGEILHYTNIMILFCDWKLLGEIKSDLVKRIKTTVSKLKEKIIPIDDWEMLGLAYGGWGYSEDIDELKEIRCFLKNISDENLLITNKSIIEEEIKNISKNVYAFCKNIIHVNGTNKYYRKPFLYLVNIDNFFYVLESLSVSDQSSIIAAFEERYGIKYSNGIVDDEYKLDKNNLIRLSELYENSLGDLEYNPPELMKRGISNRLHKLVEYFDRQNI